MLGRIAKTSVLAATAAMAISVITATGASAAPQSGVPNGYKLTFSDEFDGNSLDTSKWGYSTGASILRSGHRFTTPTALRTSLCTTGT